MAVYKNLNPAAVTRGRSSAEFMAVQKNMSNNKNTAVVDAKKFAFTEVAPPNRVIFAKRPAVLSRDTATAKPAGSAPAPAPQKPAEK